MPEADANQDRRAGLSEARRRLLEKRIRGEAAGSRAAPAKAAAAEIVPDAAGQHAPFPLTDVQHAYWVGRSPAFPLGNVAAHGYLELDVTGLDLERLTAAWQRLIARHPMLRAVVRPDGQQQVLDHVPPYVIATCDLRAADEPEAAATLASLRAARSHAQHPTDQWPLFQLTATLLPRHRTRLHISIDLLIADAWSLQILRRELGQLYREPNAQLPALELGFRDYVLASQPDPSSAATAAAWDYWHARLATLPPPPQLPLAADPASVRAPHFQRTSATLPPATWRALSQRAAACGLTPSSLLLAVFAEALARWAASPQFTLTLTLFNRAPRHPQVAALVGDFTALTLLAVDAPPDASFRARAQRLHAQLWADLDHQAVSAVPLLRALARQRGAPVAFPVVFTSTLGLASYREDAFGLAEASEVVYSVSQTPQVWLDQQVAESQGALHLAIDAVDALLPPALVAQLLDAQLTLLAHLATPTADWDAPLPDLRPASHQAITAALNATAHPFPPSLLHAPLLHQARLRPLAPAVITPTTTLSFADLLARATLLAQSLRAHGAAPNALVAVCLPKGASQVVATLATLLAGAAYVPLDPSLPPARILQLLAQTHAALVLADPADAAAFPWPDHVAVLTVPDTTPETPPPLDPIATPTDLAYVIFTSGSTGTPKGVRITHHAAANTLADLADRFALGPHDRVLGLSALSFDLSVFDLFGVLGAGGAVLLPDPDAARDPAAWHALATAHALTFWNSVPALLAMYLTYLHGQRLPLPPSLRQVWLSGDWIPLTLPAQLWALGPQVRLTSLGGATEAAIWSIAYDVPAVEASWTSIPYGRPLRNQQVWVLDAGLRERPLGVVGELYIGGVGLADGYWGDAALSAARFVRQPQTGARLYRTGDLGRYGADGTIEFLGREDAQVKVQGYRIELGEVEAALAEHAGVRAVVAAAVGERLGPKRLVAYLVPRDQQQPPASDELRAWLRERLPEYMLPSAFVLLDALPLSANGKVDRKALPAPDAADTSSRFVAPGTAAEQALAQIWAEVLGHERVGIHDDFFELGGDSILSIQIVARANQAGLRLTPNQLFQHHTIADLATIVGTAAAAAAEQGPVIGPAPLTPIQHWFFEQSRPDPQHFNQALLLELRQPLGAALLERALGLLIEHHDALRLRFERDGGGWRQSHAAPGAAVPFERIDLAGLAADHAAIEAHARALQASLDLAAGPLLRAALFERGPGLPARLLLVVHHLAMDGVSWRILVADLELLCRQLLRGEPAALPPKTSSFRQWAVRLAEHAQAPALLAELPYWRARAGAAVAPLPRDFAAGDELNTEASARSVTLALDADETRALLQDVPEVYRTQISHALLAALAQACAAWSGAPVLLADVEGHGRAVPFDEIDLSRTVGWFTAIFPALIDIDQASDPGALLRAAKEQLLRVPNDGAGYGVLRYLNDQAGAELRALPQAQVSFNYLGQLDQTLAGAALFGLAHEPTGPAESPRGRRRYLIDVRAMVVGGRLQAEWVYSAQLHQHATIERLAQGFLAALRAIIAHCRQPNAGGYTPADFLDVELSQEQLEHALAEIDFEQEEDDA